MHVVVDRSRVCAMLGACLVLHPLPLLLTYGKAVRMALQHKHACTCTCTYVHARVLIYAAFLCTHSHVHAHVTRTQAGNGTAAPAEEEAPAEGSIGFGPGLIPPHASFTEPCCMCPLYDEETGEISGWVADVPKDPRGAASTYIVVAQAIAEREDKVCCRIFPSCLLLACARSRDAVSQEHSWVGIWDANECAQTNVQCHRHLLPYTHEHAFALMQLDDEEGHMVLDPSWLNSRFHWPVEEAVSQGEVEGNVTVRNEAHTSRERHKIRRGYMQKSCTSAP